MARKDWVEVEKGTYTLKKKPTRPIVKIPPDEDESTQSQAQQTR